MAYLTKRNLPLNEWKMNLTIFHEIIADIFSIDSETISLRNFFVQILILDKNYTVVSENTFSYV